ncbi:GGDEF domain-containing protein [Conyzicola nivalis]|uniref:GGDEF domain-containing protein n=1 Tax=Conyzicola nivalis TaxID=1477021 RepID=UPI00166D7B53|nr:diguanylate cyclase [Conyzicola nivalis]
MHDPVANYAPIGLLELTAAGIIVDANDLFARWFSLSAQSVVGNHLSDVFGVGESELAEALTVAAGGTGLIPRTAVLRPAEAGARPLLLASNKIENGNTVVAVVDASRQLRLDDDAERAHLAALRQSERLQLLLAASVSFANSVTAPELAEQLAETARRTFRADWSSVHVADGTEFSLIGGTNPLVDRWPTEAPPTGARTMQLGQILAITDPEEAEQYLPGVGIADVFRASGVHSVLVSPITDHDSQIGTVACYFANRRTFDEQAEPLIRALAQQAAQVFTRLRLEERLRRSAMLDETTGLPNRRLFEQQFHGVARTPAIMFLDLDGFKQVNDELGHAAGDLLLGRVAQRLKGIFRETDSVARYGGDEFVATIEATTGSDAMAIAERARAAIAEPFPELSPHHRITASIGVALDAAPAGIASVEQLIRLADRAMYVAKSKGGNRAEVETLGADFSQR